MYSTDDAVFDYSLVAIWVIAVFTVAVGAYWSGRVRLELFILEQHQRGQDCRFLNGGNGFQENKISQSGSLQVRIRSASVATSPVPRYLPATAGADA